jgi:hypothetical protein
MPSRIAAIVIVYLVAACSECHARQIENWPYEKLFKTAEVVVIGKPVSVRDATEKDKAAPPHGEQYLVGVVTKFEILHVVKGKHDGKELELVHFRLKQKEALILNGPLLVSFHTKPVRGTENEYMLFLKAGKDERLEWVSGQFNAAYSVKQMTSPLP